MSTQKIYEEEAARLQSAFEAYKSFYSTMHKPPVKNDIDNRHWYGVFSFKMLAQITGLIGAIIVSASHTMPVLVGVDSVMDIDFGIQFVIALASFAMVEVMAINFAYNATELNAGDGTIQDVAGKIKIGERYLVFILALFNIYYVLVSNGVPIYDFIRIGIFLTIGTSAPVVAFLTGKILAVDSLKSRAKSRRETEEYETAYQLWEDELNSKWSSNKNKWGGKVNIQVSAIHSQVHSLNGANEQPLLSHSANGSVNGASVGYSKKMNARVVITQWFEANPSYVEGDETVDELHKLFTDATKQKVGRTSVHNVRKELRSK